MGKKSDYQDRQLRQLTITPKGKVKITFIDVHTIEPERGEDESTTIANEHSVKSPWKPHKDLLDAMKKLRGHAMDICEMFMDSKARAHFDVTGIKIAGDVLLKQSRVIMTVSKEVKRTGKCIAWDTPQVTMYGDSDYPKAEEMSKLIEKVIDEAWLYLEGKGESDTQLILFPKIELATA